MAPRLKTDWLLFSTILAMVGFGIVMVYSASSVVSELNPKIKDSERVSLVFALCVVVIAVPVGFGAWGRRLGLPLPAAIVFYVAGLQRKFVTAAVVAGLLFFVAFVVSKPYRLARIIGFFDPQ